MENKNEITPQELLRQLKENIREDKAPQEKADMPKETAQPSDAEIIKSYEKAQDNTVRYRFTVRRPEKAAELTEAPENPEPAVTEDSADAIPEPDTNIEIVSATPTAPVDVMKEYMTPDEIAQMQRIAAMPTAEEIAEQAKSETEADFAAKNEAAEKAPETPAPEEAQMSLTDEVEIAYKDYADYYAKLDDDSENTADVTTAEPVEEIPAAPEEEIKTSITPDEAAKRNAMAFISTLTKKAADTATDAADAAEKTVAAAAGAAVAQTAQTAAENAPEPAVPTEFDDVDVNLMLAFGMEDRLKETVGAEEAQKITEQADDDAKSLTSTDLFKTVALENMPVTEYTDPSQSKTIFNAYKSRYRKQILKIGAAVLITLFLFFFENITAMGGKLPEALNPGYYPVINILIEIQMLVFLGALSWDLIKKGFASLIARKPQPEGATAVVICLSGLYTLLTLALSRGSYSCYAMPVAFCVLLSLIGDFISLKREIYSFNIISSKKMKYSLEAVGKDECPDERKAFEYFFGDDIKKSESPDEAEAAEDTAEPVETAEPETAEKQEPKEHPLYKLKRGAFVDGFFEKIEKYPTYKAILEIIIPALAVISLLFFVLGFVRTGNIYGEIRMGYLSLVMCAPMSVFLSFSYPAYKANKKAYRNDSTVIGEAAAEEYLDAAIMTFEDKDIFPQRGVKVKSIKVYGNNRIDRVVFNAANIFRKYGGPLSQVFNKATLELGTTDNVQFGTVEDDGIEAMVAGSHVYLGKADYLRRKNYEPTIDEEDEVVEGNGGICIMFMAIEDEIAAKFYVEYTIDTEFEMLLRALYSSGICIAVRTYDPNIDDRMLNLLLRYEQFPVKVIKVRDDTVVNIAKEHTQSGVISRRSVKDMLRAFMSCEKVLRAVKVGTVLKFAAMALALAVMFVILAFGAGSGVASVYAVLYQLFWMIPLMLIVRFMV